MFDEIPTAHDGNTEEDDSEFDRRPGCVTESVTLVSSLLELGLGRDSALYRYEEHERSFIPLIGNARISGYSLDVIPSLSATLIDHGNKTKRLQSFIDTTRISSKSSSASIALASSIAAIMATMHAQIGSVSKSARDLSQLQSLFERPCCLVVSCLNEIVDEADAAMSEENLLSRLYEHVQHSERADKSIRPALFHILTSVTKPWLETVSKWIGLTGTTSARCHGHLPTFVIAEEELQRLRGGKETKKLEYNYEPLSMPKFISEEDALAIFETGKSLRLLETYQPEHPLSRPTQASTMEAPHLAWQFSWQDVERVQLQAQEHEADLQKAIADFNIHGRISERTYAQDNAVLTTDITTAGLSQETAKAYIQASIEDFEKPLPDLTADKGNNYPLNGECIDFLQEELSMSPLSLLPVSSFNPIIASQARLINRACLRLLFKEHSIQSHFSLLHRYSLFGDGVFTSRLSHALFDPELDSAERHKDRFHASASGLRLGSRDTWPPASSELRLVLTGILTESYYGSGRGAENSSMFREALPGGLSFAIRDMPGDELQRCKDHNSIEALDFLRLQYWPPPPLDVVITEASLAKYDVIFKLLLRAARMLFVANQLFRDTKSRCAIRNGADHISGSFQIEIHHFVSAICRYFFNEVQANWKILQQKLKNIDKALDHHLTSDGDSLHKVRDFHEKMLDRLMSALILGKRQAQVMKLLEGIFSLVLVFARHTRAEAARDAGRADLNIDLQYVYERFGKKVRAFIDGCRGLSEGRGEGGAVCHDAGDFEELREDGGNTIGQLLLDFEMNGFYAK